MPRSSFYVVSFLSTQGKREISRTFSTLRAARKWAKWLDSSAWASDPEIHLDGNRVAL